MRPVKPFGLGAYLVLLVVLCAGCGAAQEPGGTAEENDGVSLEVAAAGDRGLGSADAGSSAGSMPEALEKRGLAPYVVAATW